MTDVRLVAILDPVLLADRDLMAVAQATAAGGATAVQLRLKSAGAGKYVRLARRLVAALDIPVYINDRADVAWASGAAGLHVGADDVPVDRVRRASPESLRVGVSVGAPSEATAAALASADYWSIGPVYATRHKADAGSPLGSGGFASLAILAPAGTPVIAIGGITAERVPELWRAGAAGVAVIGVILQASDPQSATRHLRNAIDDASRLR